MSVRFEFKKITMYWWLTEYWPYIVQLLSVEFALSLFDYVRLASLFTSFLFYVTWKEHILLMIKGKLSTNDKGYGIFENSNLFFQKI